MDSESRGSVDIHQWIRRVQEDSESSAERLYTDTRNTSLLKQAERERLSQDISYLKQKYFPQNDELNNNNNNNNNNINNINTNTSSAPPPTSSTSSTSPSSQSSSSSTRKPIDTYNNPYTKFGARPPNLEEIARFGIGHPDLAIAAQNARDLKLVDFDHPLSDREWRRKFDSSNRQGIRDSPAAVHRAFDAPLSQGTTKSTNVYLAKDVSVAVHPKSTARPQPNKETRTREGPKKESPRTAYLEKESRRRGSPGKERNESDELNLIANFDPLAIEAHSLLHDWIARKPFENKEEEGEPPNASPSRWQQLRAGIQNLDKPSMLLPPPVTPLSLSHHHTSSSKKKIISDPPKDERRAVKATPLPPHDPRPNMEMRHEQVHQMGKRRAELRTEHTRKKMEEEEKKQEARLQEEAKRQEDKQHKEAHAKQIEAEVNQIRAKRGDEAERVKEEEIKMIEAHKFEVHRKLRAEREQVELKEARRIEDIKREEDRMRDEMRSAKHFSLAKIHADRKTLQKCMSTWYLHVRELKLKLEKFKLVCDWKKVNDTFKTWRRFAHNSKAEREANQFASRAKEEQRNLDRAVKFRDHRVILRCFLIWFSRAKLKGEERQTQHQHELRKQQMAQFLLKTKQLPNPEASPAQPPPVSPTVKTAKPAPKKPTSQKGSPSPSQKGSPCPNVAGISPHAVSPRNRSSPRTRPSPIATSSKLVHTSSPVLAGRPKTPENEDDDASGGLQHAREVQTTRKDEGAQKNYTPPAASRAYIEMESRAEQRKNRRKELELKYQEAQRQKESKVKEEEERERQRLETEKQSKMEQKRLAKQKEAADKRRREIEERSEKLAIAQDEKRLLKFYCWLPWRKYMAMQIAKSEIAELHFQQKLILKFTKSWHKITQHQIGEKLKFADEFYADNLQVHFWKTWSEALRISRMRMDEADSFYGAQVQKRAFLIWYRAARLAMDKHAAQELRRELEMEKYYFSAVVKKTWRAWRRYVVLEKEGRRSEKRKEDLRQKAHVWLQQHRQV